MSLHHGTLNAVLLPYVLEFNRSHAEAKYAMIRQRLGLNGGVDLADYVRSLNSRLGMPATLAQMGVSRDSFALIAKLLRDQSSSHQRGGLPSDP